MKHSPLAAEYQKRVDAIGDSVRFMETLTGTPIHDFARVDFLPGKGREHVHFMMDRVEEGRYDEQGRWQFLRVWNGDQTDWGLNFTERPQVLHVKLATY